MSDSLLALSDRCGIAHDYFDLWGNHHSTSLQTRMALLEAMHFPPTVLAEDPARLLDDWSAAEAQRPLPPVCVIRMEAPICLPLQLPPDASGKRWQWTVTLESGVTRSGKFVPSDLPAAAQSAAPGELQTARQLELPAIQTIGYHHLELRCGNVSHTLPLIVVPHHCYQPEAILDGGRIWGLTVQLYSVRSRRNWGIGDFTDLARLIEITAKAGGAIVGVNPLHALFPDSPTQISPYSPSQRSFVNVIYLDVEAVPEFGSCTEALRRIASADFKRLLKALRSAERVDYAGVMQAKLEILKLLFRHFQANTGKRAAAFVAWRTRQGRDLRRLALFEALQAYLRAIDTTCWGWPAWPAEYQDPDSPAVAAFAAEHADEITFHAWLQWLADNQLADVARKAQQFGMPVGIYQDLAIGANPGGAETWCWQTVFGDGAHAGAPPDEINSMGQDWGLPPFVPHRLRNVAYAPLIEILRANMKHAGALRIDHVMGLQRIFWVPGGMSASAGAYVHYPFEDMLGIVALESQRNQCIVIGEDLGTVPEGFRERLAEAGVLSYHPLIFERYPDGNFRLPAHMPAQALVAVSTHDLPTLRGFWSGLDLDIREQLALFPGAELYPRLVTERNWDRGRLLWALQRENLLPADVDSDPAKMPEMSTATVAAVHAYLARSPSQLLVIQAEDLLGVREQTNLPGTLEDKHPNWQQRLPVDLEAWDTHERAQAILAAVRSERN